MSYIKPTRPRLPFRRLPHWPRLLKVLGVALLPAVFLLSLVISTAHHANNLDGWSLERVWEHGRVSLLNVMFLDNPPTTSAIPVVEVLLANGAIEAMASALHNGDAELGHDPGGDKPYFGSFYIDESGVAQRGETCLRGRNSWHHQQRKPSLRVKLKKREVELGNRTIELSRPEDELALCNLVPTEIARDFGVLAQREEHVAFYLNNAYAGVYLRGHRPGESLALSQNRLPGTFFKGDAEDGSTLWAGPEVWQLEGEDTPVARQAFAEMLNLRAEAPDRPRLERVAKVLDLDQMARWSALNIAIGSAHTDYSHNQVFFHDAVRGLLEPVLWDPNGMGVFLPADAPVDLFNSPIESMLSYYPDWVHQRNLYLEQLLTTFCQPDALNRRIESHLKAIRPWLQADPELGRLIRQDSGLRLATFPVTELPQVEDRLFDWVSQRHGYLRSYLDTVKFSVQGQRDSTRVVVEGRIAVRAVGPDGQERLLYPGLAREKTRPYQQGLLNCAETLPAPLAYELPWPPSRTTFFNAVTGAVVTPGPGGILSQSTRSLPPEVKPARVPRTVTWGPGTVTVRADQVFDSDVTIRILAGTRLVLGPGVSVMTRGPLLAQGTPSAPIEIVAAGSQPWGTLALHGPATRGSVLSYLKVSGGSRGQRDFLVFKGMLSVHGCPDLLLENCQFTGNFLGDDAANFVESAVVVRDCSWAHTRSDGLDLDACTGTVSRCVFSANGNDGLDLSMNQVTITACRFEKNGDKGLSVGEASRVTVADCAFADNAKGVQVKDDSVAEIHDCTFENNGIALDAYRKKWVYRRGGEVKVSSSQFSGQAQELARRDGRSAIIIHGVPFTAVTPASAFEEL